MIMTTVYAVSEEEYTISSQNGIVTFFPGVTVNLNNVLKDFNEAEQLILFTDEAAAKAFATGNSRKLQNGSKTALDTTQRAILQMNIESELLNNRTLQPVQREIASDQKFKVNPRVPFSTEAYLVQKSELLVAP